MNRSSDPSPGAEQANRQQEVRQRLQAQLLAGELAKPGSRWTDDQLVSMFRGSPPSYNALWAALGYFDMTASVCAYRPHLSERVLYYPLHALQCLGLQSANDAVRFVEFHFDRRSGWGWFKSAAYFPKCSQQARDWLRSDLPEMRDVLQRVFDDLLRDDFDRQELFDP